MLSFSGSLKVFVAVEPCDMRKGFNGLFTAVTQRLSEDPKSGALFVLGNRRRNRLKLLYFDGTGVCVLAKRLEEGTFHWPQSAGEPGAKMTLDIDPTTHPAWTGGQQNLLDRGGRLTRFNKRFGNFVKQ